MCTRYVVGWSLSNTMRYNGASRCSGKPSGVTDAQRSSTATKEAFTSVEYVQLLEGNSIAIIMDSRGRALDDIFTVRLWRSV